MRVEVLISGILICSMIDKIFITYLIRKRISDIAIQNSLVETMTRMFMSILFISVAVYFLTRITGNYLPFLLYLPAFIVGLVFAGKIVKGIGSDA